MIEHVTKNRLTKVWVNTLRDDPYRAHFKVERETNLTQIRLDKTHLELGSPLSIARVFAI